MSKVNIPQKEEEILNFWKENKIFEKTLLKNKGKDSFVFYEGPPTANGKPGIHHILARAFKDALPRYKTMNGFMVERKAGWDTHGLPVELEVEKKLGFSGKGDIEKYGVEKFNKQCKESVWEYKEEWEKMTERIGFWLDLENPYVTYSNDYIESLWWIISEAHKKGLLYRGHKVVPQCPRCGTALSSHEVAQGYKEVEETSVYVKFKLKDKDNEYILAWTTTPWTLPGNIALAVGEKIDYVRVIKDGEKLWVATDLVHKIFRDFDAKKDKKGYDSMVQYPVTKGKDLVGLELEYEPLFEDIGKKIKKEDKKNKAFKIYSAKFVSTDEGTGIVHIAPMYGLDDYELDKDLPKIHTVNPDGTFNNLVSKWEGRLVKVKKEDSNKDVNEEIIEDLKERNLFFAEEKYKHDYPFCWRCDSPLIYYAKDSWFFKMTELREKLIENNSKINWVPAHIKEGRFGEWLREVKDWAISRERYWGTPLPVWICEKCNEMKVVSSREELGVKEDFDLHKPYIDEIELDCSCGGKMKRTPEVMDCWFDSGAMPFAQLHYPFENKELVDCEGSGNNCRFPADYISEAIDQTRGWFYTLLAVSTILGRTAPYKNVVCLGHVLDKNGKKMSKSKGNVVNPWEMIDKYGSDTVRFYLYTINQPGDPKRFDEQGLKEKSRVFMTLLNVLSFYRMFKSEDSVEFSSDSKNILDKWVVSKLNILIKEVSEKMDEYDITTSARKIEEFINELSTWYLRRSRGRFKTEEKENALKVLGFVLNELSKLLAPFTPFMAESLYKELGGEKESIHLEDWSKVGEIDEKLLKEMQVVRDICELGHAEREKEAIKVRQVLAKATIKNLKLKENLSGDSVEIIKEELNVKEVEQNKGADNLEVKLDTKITDDLKREGYLREIIRMTNALRKEAGFTINDKASLNWQSESEEIKKVFERFSEEIKKGTSCTEINVETGIIKPMPDKGDPYDRGWNPENFESDIIKKIKVDEGIEVWVGVKKM